MGNMDFARPQYTKFQVALMGVATNTLAICTILISSQLHNAFGYISTSQSTANIVVSLIFCFWAAPLALK